MINTNRKLMVEKEKGYCLICNQKFEKNDTILGIDQRDFEAGKLTHLIHEHCHNNNKDDASNEGHQILIDNDRHFDQYTVQKLIKDIQFDQQSLIHSFNY